MCSMVGEVGFEPTTTAFAETYSNEADLDLHTLLGYKIAFAACLSVVIPKNGLTVDFSTFNCHKALDCSGLVQNDY